MNKLAVSTLGGFVSTAPMTLLMQTLFEKLPLTEKYPLPLREITDQVIEKSGVARQMDEPQKKTLAIGAHFGFGAAAGAVTGQLPLEIGGNASFRVECLPPISRGS